ncbi:MAG: endonuclease/exonuclease/phosphatase family protein [Bacteroidia bacterium]|nr:endonuclease/exonuclease/phosphatase family protein [Bacteroidia bacterium]
MGKGDQDEKPFSQTIKKGFFILNLGTLIPLLLANLAPYVLATDAWIINFCSLFFPYWVLIPVAWVIFWVPFQKFYSVFNFILLLLNVPKLLNTIQFNSPETYSEKDIKVLTYNVDAFEYRLSKFDSIANFIAAQHPDIVCLQEVFDVKNAKSERAMNVLAKKLGFDNAFFVELLPNTRFGMAILSRYPFEKTKSLTRCGKDTQNGIIYADIKVYGKEVRIYNLHLESYRLSEEQKGILMDKESEQRTVRGVWKTLKKLLKSWRKQEYQIAKLEEDRKKWKGAVILCGDLNNPPYNYVYRTVKEGLIDCFREKGRGLGLTYGKGFANFRIDYVMASSHFRTVDFQTLSSSLSDHQPVLGIIRFKFHQ